MVVLVISADFWADCVSTVGLLFDIAGVVILFRYGFRSEINTALKGQLWADEDSETRKPGIIRAEKIAPWGLGLLVAGFGLQAVAVWLV